MDISMDHFNLDIESWTEAMIGASDSLPASSKSENDGATDSEPFAHALDLLTTCPTLISAISQPTCQKLANHLLTAILHHGCPAARKDLYFHSLSIMFRMRQVSIAQACDILAHVVTLLAVDHSHNDRGTLSVRDSFEEAFKIMHAVLVPGAVLPHAELCIIVQRAVALLRSEDGATVRKLTRVLKQVHAFDQSSFDEHISEVFQVIYTSSGTCSGAIDTFGCIRRAPADAVYDILCGLAEFLSSPTVRHLVDCRLWVVVQQGLYHNSSLARKQSLFFLRCVQEQYGSQVSLAGVPRCGCCMPGLASTDCDDSHCPMLSRLRTESVVEANTVWCDYILLVETLGEKQYHVIEPVLPRLQLIVTACEQGHLHSSWLATLLVRAFRHESAVVRRWSICQLLALDIGKCRFIQHGLTTFLLETVIAMVTSDINLFFKQRGDPVGAEPEVSRCCQQYVVSCERAIPTQAGKANFFHRLLAVLADGAGSGWCPVPGMYLCKALQYLPMAAYWDRRSIRLLCHTLAVTIRQADTRVRLATQLFLLQSMFVMADKAAVEVGDLVQLVKALSADEILLPPKGLPRQRLMQWLKDVFLVWGTDKCTAAITYLISGCHGELVLMLSDADLLPKSGPLSYKSWLVTLADTLACSAHRAYLSQERVDTALDAVVCLLRWTVDMDAHRELTSSMATECSLLIIVSDDRRDIEDGTSLTYARSMTALKAYCKFFGYQADSQLEEFVLRMASRLAQLPAASVKMELTRWSLLASICECYEEEGGGHMGKLPLTFQALNDLFTKLDLHRDLLLPDPRCIENAGERGRVMNSLISARWRCRRLLLTSISATVVDRDAWAAQALDTLGLVSDDSNVVVFRALQPLIVKLESHETVMTIINTCWSKAEEEARANSYPQQFTELVKMAFQPQLMGNEHLEDFCCKLASRALDIGAERLGLANVVAAVLLDVFRRNLSLAATYVNLLVDLATYGTLPSKTTRTDLEVYSQLENIADCRELCRWPGELSVSWSKASGEVRGAVVRFLMALNPGECEQARLGCAFVHICLARFVDSLALKTFRNFPHSLLHRQRHRLLSAALILFKFCLVDSAGTQQIIDFALSAFTAELQPSNRLQLEWLLVLALHFSEPMQRDRTVADLCDTTKMASKRPVFVCSVLTALAHLCTLTSDIKNSSSAHVTLIGRVVTAILPWTMCSKYHVRAYAQAALLKIWQHNVPDSSDGSLGRSGMKDASWRPTSAVAGDATASCATFSDGVLSNPLLHSVIKTVLDTGVIVERTTKKLFEHFFWKLRPVDDLCVEAVYSLLPHLSGVAADESVDPKLLEPWGPDWSIALYCNNQHLKDCKPGPAWQVATRGLASSEHQADSDVDGLDVQKKIVTWRTQEPDAADEEGLFNDSAAGAASSHGRMVLIASLVDRMPNIAGLCRTSEIFGVREFVMSNLSMVEDVEFQGISVSAQRWIRMKEVSPPQLKSYLQEMRQQGYTLLGVEQTANSVTVTDYTFPVKTALLLGNEKLGIPADIIHLLDVCIQIPQQGIIRSLNVHVCGALVVWEYRRQMLLKQAS